jgi:hypothetical protein
MNQFPATRQAALERLDDFLGSASRYAAERNYVIPDHPNVSRLSAAIRHRLITEEEVVAMALRRHPFRAIEKWLQEVLWRGYWKGWLEVRPQVWESYRMSVGELAGCGDAARLEVCHALAEGRSRSGIMNHFAQELRDTGYLHNHARMWWASYWIHHCGLPWELGAQHFFRSLLDADPASNTLSWRWVAGRQTRGKAYLATSQNVARFCDPEILSRSGGIGIEEGGVSAMVGNDGPESEAITEVPDFPNAPDPNPENHRTALLLHDEDLCLETGLAANLRPSLVFQFVAEAGDPPPPPRAEWLGLARADAGKRAGEHFRCGVVLCGAVDEIVKACAADRIKMLVVMEPFVGPLQDQLQGLAAALLCQGTDILRLRRRWDTSVLPHASRGFFPFWNKVGRLLEKSGIEGLT